MSWQRYVALGDSFTEGVGDVDPTRPNGVRGWADRVAEVLAAQTPDFGYANLAIRGRKLDGIVAEQIEPAIALQPDLITIYAGANDILRPSVDLDSLVEKYDDALGRLATTGATLLIFTAFDPAGSAIYKPVRGRFATYNELVRWSADRHGAQLVDFWRFRDYRDWRLWDTDRMHMSSLGHRRMAAAVLDVLEVPHDLALPNLSEMPVAQQTWRENVQWTRDFLAPWVHRRVTGRSSGDGMAARRPVIAPLTSAGTIPPTRQGGSLRM